MRVDVMVVAMARFYAAIEIQSFVRMLDGMNSLHAPVNEHTNHKMSSGTTNTEASKRHDGTMRKLRSGREVAENTFKKNLTISTKAPGKWVAVDLETGSVWMGEAVGWVQATPEVIQEVKAAVDATAKTNRPT